MKRVPTVVGAAELAAYAPANHSGTSNVRVIGPETVGATALEVLVGTIVKSHSARPDAYPDLEQCAYMMEGTRESESAGRVEAIGAGSWSYMPAVVFHSFRVTSVQPGRLLVVYAPVYGENPAHTITEPDDSAAVRPRGGVRVLAPRDAASTIVPLIDRETVGARWVEIAALRMRGGSALFRTTEPRRGGCSLPKRDGSMCAPASKHSTLRRATSCSFHARPPRPAVSAGRTGVRVPNQGRLPSSTQAAQQG
jgi:uncharacterized RmlC-like cupin family protein